jgi:RimJ/RimL family protein N-acetyltransferase
MASGIATTSRNEQENYRIRPIEASDKEGVIGLFEQLSPQSRYLRFAHAISKLPDAFLEDILHLDYRKEMALVAIIKNPEFAEQIIGLARYVTLPDQEICEFSISVSDLHTTHGIGTHLMQALITHAQTSGLEKMIGFVLSANLKMLKLVGELGFEIEPLEDDPEFKLVSLSL